jgi:hypothetical protein
MQSKSMRRPAPALIVAIIALVAALAGSAVALPGKNSVKSNDIAKNAVKSKHVKNNKLKGADINEAKLGQVPSAARADSAGAVDTVKVSGLKKVNATEGADFDAARAAAPEVTLLTKGALTVYGKCFTRTDADITYAYTYIKTSQNGSVFTAGNDSLEGDDFLDTNTDEEDRELYNDSAGNDDASGFRNMFDAAAPDGTLLNGMVTQYAKNGDLTGGDGIYGAGDVCLLGASALG